MSWIDFEKKLQNARFDFTDEQLKNLKLACTNMYEILKYVFDSPRKLYRPYNSLTDYKVKKEHYFTSPSDFYSFRYDNVLIQIHFRYKRFYSVGVFGYEFLDDSFMKLKSEKSNHEKSFSNGFHYYGWFSRNEFNSCIDLFNLIVNRYLEINSFSVDSFNYGEQFKNELSYF